MWKDQVFAPKVFQRVTDAMLQRVDVGQVSASALETLIECLGSVGHSSKLVSQTKSQVKQRLIQSGTLEELTLFANLFPEELFVIEAIKNHLDAASLLGVTSQRVQTFVYKMAATTDDAFFRRKAQALFDSEDSFSFSSEQLEHLSKLVQHSVIISKLKLPKSSHFARARLMLTITQHMYPSENVLTCLRELEG